MQVNEDELRAMPLFLLRVAFERVKEIEKRYASVISLAQRYSSLPVPPSPLPVIARIAQERGAIINTTWEWAASPEEELFEELSREELSICPTPALHAFYQRLAFVVSNDPGTVESPQLDAITRMYLAVRSILRERGEVLPA